MITDKRIKMRLHLHLPTGQQLWERKLTLSVDLGVRKPALLAEELPGTALPGAGVAVRVQCPQLFEILLSAVRPKKVSEMRIQIYLGVYSPGCYLKY